MKQSIGEFLATLRKAHGYTQQEVADRLSVSNRTVSAWERGTVMPDILLLPALAELYGVTADEILAGERRQGAESAEHKELSKEAQARLSENKFAHFSTRSGILFAVFAAGALLLFLGWWFYAERKKEGLLAAILIGAAAVLFAVVCLAVVWRGAAHSAESGAGEEFRTRLIKRMALYAFLGAGLCLVFAAVPAVPVFRAILFYRREIAGAEGVLVLWLRDLLMDTYAAYLPPLCTFAAAALLFAACGLALLLLKRAKNRK